ncbi:PVC-type heme-binding CxxCH protein [Pelagicoccus sp. SDUM812002]|uniref:PVC-type heme-binding CxxCH protein n=1 Tax=Pelagicoccus sp. SDUM812002 TaxID=3041266 RepID=UPI00280C8B3A|nr:PVC-type heme-binding CxxCH protein [Pelagicoccus sp. SDUM812002]MDQ8187057.1 PQQ-dependent sugar dehydrogenase [Pelagicoccus sp. SDUM812002]
MRNLVIAIALCGLSTSSLFAAKMKLNDADRRPEPIILEASPDVELALQQMQLPEGMEATLWAAEPMLANPVAFDFDEHGRLFVAETYRYGSSTLDIRGYMGMLEEDMAFRTVEDRAQGIIELFGDDAPNFAVEGEILRLLEDRDGDGTADFSSVYADGFNTSVDGIASGVLARKGDIYFTNIPHLWKFQGIDDTGKAQKSEKVLSGWGVHFGYTGHDFHGLILGPDGKLYFSIGDRGADVTAPDGSHISYPDTGAVYRSNLDGTELEVVHTGLRNPQELAFDEFGNLFTGDNDCDNGDFERLVLIAEGGDSGWRIGHQHAPLGAAGVWMSEGWWQTEFEGRTKFALPPISYIEDGPSGIAFYPGTGLSPDYAGHLFITHFKGTIATSGVYTYTMKPKGAWFELDEKKPFAKGVLPTDVTFAPDGKFYVLDWVNGWPKPGQGRVYSISNPEVQASSIVAETQKLYAEGMTGRSVEELASLLSHPNWNIRLEAQLELASRGEDSLQTFVKIAQDSNSSLHSRLHATWGLGILADHEIAKANAAISKLAASENDEPEVVAQATKLIGDHKISGNEALLIEHLAHPSSRVRYFAAQSIGKLEQVDAAPALLQAALENADEDPYLSHAIVMGLVGAKNMGALAEAVTDEAKAVRFATLLAYRRLGDVNVARFLHDSDKEIVFEAARAINDAPIQGAYHSLAKAIDSPFADDPILAIRAINARFRIGGEDNAQFLANYAANESNPQDFRLEAITQLKSWPDPLQRDRVIGVYQPLAARNAQIAIDAFKANAKQFFASENNAVQVKFLQALKELEVTGLEDQLYAFAKDESANGEARAAAFALLNTLNDPRMDELVIAASQSNASELRLATLPIVSERSPEQAKVTLSLMAEGSVEEQRVAYETLAGSQQDFAIELLAKSIGRLAAGDVPYAAQLELIEAAKENSSKKVQQAFQDYQAKVAASSDPTAAFSYALEGGDERAGRRVFNNNQVMACVRCHIVNGPGDAAGPNLTDVGLRLNRQELLESIVAPNATIAEGFDNVILSLQDGTSVAGIVENENDDEVTLKLVSGETKTYPQNQIEKRDAMPSSMPAIFAPLLSQTDMRDLVEYLSTRTWDPNTERTTHGE